MAKFKKGESRPANSGRRAGTPNKGTERARRLVAEDDDKIIVNQVVEAAKAGDRSAQTVYFRYIRPSPPAALTTPIAGYRAPGSVGEAREMILWLGSQLAEGAIGATIHDALVGGLRAYLADQAAERQKELDLLRENLKG